MIYFVGSKPAMDIWARKHDKTPADMRHIQDMSHAREQRPGADDGVVLGHDGDAVVVRYLRDRQRP
jgi:hypothetical protein